MFSLSVSSVSPGLQVQVGGVDGVGEGDVGGGALVVGGRLAAGLAAPGAGAGSGGRASCASSAAPAAGYVAGFWVPAFNFIQNC